MIKKTEKFDKRFLINEESEISSNLCGLLLNAGVNRAL